ncbi:transposase [Nonomuraea fuscirosea]|uniref:transposase n=1 Tax=Nonomuraea fuscirosea TaxID=1291556 RepID=UPI003F4DB154
MLVVDDAGFEKRGRRSTGVQRQYIGTAGKIIQYQVGCFPPTYTYPGRQRVLIYREL